MIQQFEVIREEMLPYLAGRELQERLLSERRSGQRADTLIFCEHPPTFTFGRRAGEEVPAESVGRQAACFRVGRGGAATYHGPGQLVIYPVVLLPELRVGIKNFVCLMMQALAEATSSFGIAASVRLNPLGVWIESRGSSPGKIAAAGLQVVRGGTLHGFSWNYACDLSYFDAIAPCGLPPGIVTSLSSELGRPVGRSEVEGRLEGRLHAHWPQANFKRGRIEKE